MKTDYEKTVSEAWEQATEDGDTGMENRFRELTQQFTTSVTDWHAIAIEAGLVGPASPAPSGVALIAQERQRQIEVEGWTPEHDDRHTEDELESAAAAYILGPVVGYNYWPWVDETGEPVGFKPRGHKPEQRLHDLTIAGALIAAELDRLLRTL